jgi:HAD superfamily hydrolase (TIGR01509 family)
MTLENLTTFIFDLGGIVVPEAWQTISKEIADYMQISPEKLKSFTEYQQDLRTGNLTLEQYYVQVLSRLGNTKLTSKQVLHKHLESYKTHGTEIDQRVFETIEKLKEKYQVVCLTNTEREIGDFNRQRGLFNIFEKQYLSSEIGFQKPSQEVWEYVLRDLGIKPKNAFFIDDTQECIENARQLGISTHHYKGFKIGFKDFQNKINQFL